MNSCATDLSLKDTQENQLSFSNPSTVSLNLLTAKLHQPNPKHTFSLTNKLSRELWLKVFSMHSSFVGAKRRKKNKKERKRNPERKVDTRRKALGANEKGEASSSRCLFSYSAENRYIFPTLHDDDTRMFCRQVCDRSLAFPRPRSFTLSAQQKHTRTHTQTPAYIRTLRLRGDAMKTFTFPLHSPVKYRYLFSVQLPRWLACRSTRARDAVLTEEEKRRRSFNKQVNNRKQQFPANFAPFSPESPPSKSIFFAPQN